MNDFQFYILLGLSAALLIIVLIMIMVTVGLKKRVESSEQKYSTETEHSRELLKQDIENVQNNVRGIQNTIAQSYTGMQTGIQQTMTQNYSSLNQTLNSKLQSSFDSINSYLQIMNKDLGEMKNIAGGIDDVRKVLSNTKSRGILGELQLGAILGEVMSKSQYDENVATIPGSTERVEFAVKLPAEGGYIYLPIDSKFPGDTYRHLLDAYDSADDSSIKSFKATLVTQFKSEAKDISKKYVKYPYTTEFAVMFLPFEGLYSEAVNLGMVEVLQREYNIMIAGPSTMAAFLSSLQMGFKTLAIQENAEKVWQVLAKVKSEFENFESVLNATQKKINDASTELDKLVGVRTRKILKALEDVEKLDGLEVSEDGDIFDLSTTD